MRINRKALIAIFVVLLVALSSSRLLDDYVDDYTDSSIKNAALTYATARGINALVSMMQSSEIEAGIGIVSGSITIGELLDPLNDMIERFSTVMTWVLASLAAQKVLLLLASHELFLYLVAVLGISALLLLFYGRSRPQNLVFKSFLVVVFIRFALGMAVVLNSGVDYLFLDQQLQANDKEIENFRANIMSVDAGDEFDTDSIRDSAIDFWQNLSMSEFENKISRGIENFINLVAIYLLKTILFPLGFFYAAIFAVKQLWRVDLNVDLPDKR
jgi:signal transduction histidine kinase